MIFVQENMAEVGESPGRDDVVVVEGSPATESAIGETTIFQADTTEPFSRL